MDTTKEIKDFLDAGGKIQEIPAIKQREELSIPANPRPLKEKTPCGYGCYRAKSWGEPRC